MMAERLTLPAPIIATQTRDNCLPANASIKKPAKGKAGTSHNRLFILFLFIGVFSLQNLSSYFKTILSFLSTCQYPMIYADDRFAGSTPVQPRLPLLP